VEKLSEHPEYSDYLTVKYKRDLVKAAPLHDIGKVGVPDAILKKKGRLTEDEFAIMKKHCEYGARVLKIADEKLGFESFLKLAIQIVLTHHEKWDGSGYPQGLKGEAIPLSGRIMAVADVYDALRSERCYKSSFSHEKACRILQEEKGKHFDPLLIDILFECENDFKIISSSLGS
jgi:HD-GYP domain-containing protein (c-di-GMP phosphodiesterase class II)